MAQNCNRFYYLPVTSPDAALLNVGAAVERLAQAQETGIPCAAVRDLIGNGEVRSSGHGVACLGDQLEALRWLAVQCHRFGDPLRAGQVVLSGALGPFVPFAAGDRVAASISGFEPLEVTFID